MTAWKQLAISSYAQDKRRICVQEGWCEDLLALKKHNPALQSEACTGRRRGCWEGELAPCSPSTFLLEAINDCSSEVQLLTTPLRGLIFSVVGAKSEASFFHPCHEKYLELGTLLQELLSWAGAELLSLIL